MIRCLLIHFHTVNGDMTRRNVHNTAHFKMVPAPKMRINKYNECHEQKWETESTGAGHSSQGKRRATGYWILTETPTSDISIWALETLGPLRWAEIVLTVITNSGWVFVIYLSHHGKWSGVIAPRFFLVCYITTPSVSEIIQHRWWMNEYGAFVKSYWEAKTRVLADKPA
jgi:hypothetical protein